jgi:hypothetical protein
VTVNLSIAPTCEHDWVALGVRWLDTHHNLPGSGATSIEYYDVFHCRHCCAIQKHLLKGIHTDSYQPKLPGTMPLGENR